MTQEYKEVDFGEKMGFSELYEWGEENPTNYFKDKTEYDINFHAKLVQFSDKFPHTVIRARNTDKIVGISTIASGYLASNPSEWPFKYIINEFGDLYLNEVNIAEGKKIYDPIHEMSIMSTTKKSIIAPIINPDYKNDKNYIQRKNRGDWCNVVLLGKAIVEDNGQCEPGKYCTLYKGHNEKLYGTVEPATNKDKFKLLVLQRLSQHSIIVFYAPQIYSNK